MCFLLSHLEFPPCFSGNTYCHWLYTSAMLSFLPTSTIGQILLLGVSFCSMHCSCPLFHVAICLPSTYTSPQGFVGCLFYFAIKQPIIYASTLVTFWRGLGSLQVLCVFWCVFHILRKIALLIVTLIWNHGNKHSWPSVAILRRIWWGSSLHINLWQGF